MSDNSRLVGGEFYDNACYGVRIFDSGSGISADNNTVRDAALDGNTVRDNIGNGIDIQQGAVNTDVQNNNLSGNGTGLVKFNTTPMEGHSCDPDIRRSVNCAALWLCGRAVLGWRTDTCLFARDYKASIIDAFDRQNTCAVLRFTLLTPRLVFQAAAVYHQSRAKPRSSRVRHSPPSFWKLAESLRWTPGSPRQWEYSRG